MTLAPILDSSNSKCYNPLPTPKHAIIEWSPQEYKLPWGNQTFEGPHMQIHPTVEGQTYGCDLRIFFETHDALPDNPDRYVKNVAVQATQITEPCLVYTIVNGDIEAISDVPVGSWLVRNPEGEQYPMTDENFRAMYDVENAR